MNNWKQDKALLEINYFLLRFSVHSSLYFNTVNGYEVSSGTKVKIAILAVTFNLQSWTKMVGTLAHNCTLFSHPSHLPLTPLSMLYFCERNEQIAPHKFANLNID